MNNQYDEYYINCVFFKTFLQTRKITLRQISNELNIKLTELINYHNGSAYLDREILYKIIAHFNNTTN